MTFKNVEHDVLAHKIHLAMETLVKFHFPDRTIDLNDMKPSVALLETERRVQCEFLLTVESLTRSMDVSTAEGRQLRDSLLNAAAYYIHEQINRPFVESYIVLSKVEKSKLYTGLTSALELTKENEPDKSELLGMYTQLSKLICDNVYVNGTPTDGFLPKEKQVFSAEFIPDYKVKEDIVYLADQIRILKKSIKKDEIKQVDGICKEEKKQIKASFKPEAKAAEPVASSGFLGLFAKKSKSVKKADESTNDSTSTVAVNNGK